LPVSLAFLIEPLKALINSTDMLNRVNQMPVPVKVANLINDLNTLPKKGIGVNRFLNISFLLPDGHSRL
jgi:hypothetical protein